MVVYQQQLLQFDREHTDRQNRLMQSTWLDLDTSSRVAASNHIAWQQPYELFEFVGAGPTCDWFASGSVSGGPIERWGCWILLGVLLLHLYFGNGRIQP